MAQPSTLGTSSINPSAPDATAPSSIFGGAVLNTAAAASPTTAQTAPTAPRVPAASAFLSVGALSSTSVASNSTYIMPNSPLRNRPGADGYRPKVTRTLGQRPACLVNASVTYCGNNQIYAFGGFDQYTDEVYNHVLRLDVVSQQWSLVDNYGDIPGVRMGHTATLYQGDKLLVFGGENEHRTYLSDLIVFDLKTAHWTQPQVSGPIPKDRARHAAVLHDDKLFILGGITGRDNYVLDDICYLDLKTYTWSRSWRFVSRFDHSAYIWDDRVWVFGGLSKDMDKVSDLWWLDLKGSPAFQSAPQFGSMFDQQSMASRGGSMSRPGYSAQSSTVGASGYAANSRTAQVNTPSFQLKSYSPVAPGTISVLKFCSGLNMPNQGSGIHFHVYSSGVLLDFVTPAATITSRECSMNTLDLATMRWQRLAEGREIFKMGYRWHYCTINEDGTKAWLLGCPNDPGSVDLGTNGLEEYLSDIMEIDLRRYGFLGNTVPDARSELVRPTSRVRHIDTPSRGLGSDLAKLFDQPPEAGSGADFIVTAHSGNCDDDDDDVMGSALIPSGEGPDGTGGGGCSGGSTWLSPDAPTSPPIHVHRLILQARWPHFARLWSSQMAEFHTKRMHIPEPYSVVRAFLYYLYTDRIDPPGATGDGAATSSAGSAGVGTTSGGSSNMTADLSDVAGLLVMSNIYNIPHLRLLCVNRLWRELDVEHACIIWHCASLANEEWLRKRAAGFCLTHWGRIVRSSGFLRLPRAALVELSQEIDTEGRVIGGDELDMFGSAMDGNRYSDTGSMASQRKESVSSHPSQMAESEAEDEDGMEMS
ncbi:kelch repeat protein [Grosmannia clavigera kw1407]|uniref:Kelch repeat protein n=1 Tax=Grosmannia clavigera (strain kw1407 / UAMH 11150) TaxID=655863 RepID=F0XU92_GROCL|nr:kelch repeat protein [Grosmannia clavigera kw1407]EFW98517.1 kelch repeat protein [Grosmannia clavigera kw1407]